MTSRRVCGVFGTHSTLDTKHDKSGAFRRLHAPYRSHRVRGRDDPGRAVPTGKRHLPSRPETEAPEESNPEPTVPPADRGDSFRSSSLVTCGNRVVCHALSLQSCDAGVPLHREQTPRPSQSLRACHPSAKCALAQEIPVIRASRNGVELVNQPTTPNRQESPYGST